MSTATLKDNALVKPEQDAELAELLAKAAMQQAESETDTVPFISLKGKKFTIGDEKLGTTLDVVILASVADNAWYDRKYDPSSGEVSPPACFSIGGKEPHSDSPKPQHDDCASCPKNQYESAENGKGKACRNGRRLLVASVKDGKVNLANLAIINVAPTTLKAISKYIKSVNIIKGLPCWAVVTRVSFDEDVAWPLLTFTLLDVLDAQYLGDIARSLVSYEELVSVPYNTAGYVTPDEQIQKEAPKKSKVS